MNEKSPEMQNQIQRYAISIQDLTSSWQKGVPNRTPREAETENKYAISLQKQPSEENGQRGTKSDVP